MNDLKLSRRGLVQGLGLAGVGTALLSFQNCGTFDVMKGSSVDASSGPSPTPTPQVCNRPLSIFDTDSTLPAFPNNVTPVPPVASGLALDHHPNANVYSVPYFDHFTNTQSTAYLLTIDVGPNPAGGELHATASSNSNTTNIVTDVYVLNGSNNNELLFAKRFGGSEHTASAMFILPEALVASQAQLFVAVCCLTHGFFVQTVDLSVAPMSYSAAVTAFDSTKAFGGCNFLRPYVSIDATGGQGNIGNIHAPSFVSVTNDQVVVTLGPSSSKHGRFGEGHYIAGGVLLDQNSNVLAPIAHQSYAQSANHQLVFSGFDLAARRVTSLRVIVMDTFNGYLQSFKNI